MEDWILARKIQTEDFLSKVFAGFDGKQGVLSVVKSPIHLGQQSAVSLTGIYYLYPKTQPFGFFEFAKDSPLGQFELTYGSARKPHI